MDNKDKFTDKVKDYVKYRPSYPPEFIQYLVHEVGISKGSTVADIGAGTGILTRLLSDKVKRIYGVEPNKNMRDACVSFCGSYGSFVPVEGSAEDTTLPVGSVDFITVAQAFHWFDRQKCRLEFQRILKPGGRVTLVWNSRVADSALIQENDELCKALCPEFNGFSGGTDDRPDAYDDFFKDGISEYRVFENNRLLTLESFIGGSLSASYAPSGGDGNYRAFVEGLTSLFYKYSKGGRLLMPNRTRSYTGRV